MIILGITLLITGFILQVLIPSTIPIVVLVIGMALVAAEAMGTRHRRATTLFQTPRHKGGDVEENPGDGNQGRRQGRTGR